MSNSTAGARPGSAGEEQTPCWTSEDGENLPGARLAAGLDRAELQRLAVGAGHDADAVLAAVVGEQVEAALGWQR